ncbi:DnaA N-terminal domain-containing protein [Frigidibacter sp. MR17.24]|uniref:DnaA N-terminal domain-containing protein n=1 Tax=Frigidibacter sp. MR17.24 TaxID=3127345 RepID=UPI003012FF4F
MVRIEGQHGSSATGNVPVQLMSGAGAASRKYDLLSAIGAAGLAGDPADQRRALRLMVLVTARYDWRRDRLAVGQREIAALWSVDERTVKREMARLRDAGWLILRRQGARGRVSEYALAIETILAATRPHWAAVGPDLVERLSATAVPAGTDPKVIPFPGGTGTEPEASAPGVAAPAIEPKPRDQGLWGRISASLSSDNPARHAAWIAPLVAAETAEDRLVLRAPSRFHASYVETHLGDVLRRAARRLMPDLALVRVIAD